MVRQIGRLLVWSLFDMHAQKKSTETYFTSYIFIILIFVCRLKIELTFQNPSSSALLILHCCCIHVSKRNSRFPCCLNSLSFSGNVTKATIELVKCFQRAPMTLCMGASGPFPNHFNGCEELANTQSQMWRAFSCLLTHDAKSPQAAFLDIQV